MARLEDKDTRYFIEIDLESLKIIKCSFGQKQNLDKGRQSNSGVHRLFLTKGQYHKFVERCSSELEAIIETWVLLLFGKLGLMFVLVWSWFQAHNNHMKNRSTSLRWTSLTACAASVRKQNIGELRKNGKIYSVDHLFRSGFLCCAVWHGLLQRVFCCK